MKTTCISEEYRVQENVPEFDDTELKDEWQLPVYLFARGVIQMENQSGVVDIGCGSGYKLTTLFDDFSSIGVEARGATLDFLKDRYPHGHWASIDDYRKFLVYIETEGSEIFKQHCNETLCICSDVIEHVEDPVGFFDYLLKTPWSSLIISTPIRHDAEHFGPPGNIHHYREWDEEDFSNFLKQWEDQIEIKLHCCINPEQRTQMAWLKRKSAPVQETEST